MGLWLGKYTKLIGNEYFGVKNIVYIYCPVIFFLLLRSKNERVVLWKKCSKKYY